MLVGVKEEIIGYHVKEAEQFFEVIEGKQGQFGDITYTAIAIFRNHEDAKIFCDYKMCQLNPDYVWM